jgi:hypothetical protein
MADDAPQLLAFGFGLHQKTQREREREKRTRAIVCKASTGNAVGAHRWSRLLQYLAKRIAFGQQHLLVGIELRLVQTR